MRALAPQVVIHPLGESVPSAPGVLALPQLAATSTFVFGDGSHPTTRLCAGAVDALCREHRPHTVLDVGTGTGILARIARARGAGAVYGTDIDAAALASARANAALDRDLPPIRFGTESPAHWVGNFDLVVANILEAPLVELAAALAGATRAGGLLLISGFTRLQAPRLRVHYEHLALRCRRAATLDDWVLLMFQKDAAPR